MRHGGAPVTRGPECSTCPGQLGPSSASGRFWVHGPSLPTAFRKVSMVGARKEAAPPRCALGAPAGQDGSGGGSGFLLSSGHLSLSLLLTTHNVPKSVWLVPGLPSCGGSGSWARPWALGPDPLPWCGERWSRHRALGSWPGGHAASSGTWSLSAQYRAEVTPSLQQGSRRERSGGACDLDPKPSASIGWQAGRSRVRGTRQEGSGWFCPPGSQGSGLPS